MRETCDATLDSTAVMQRKTYVDNRAAAAPDLGGRRDLPLPPVELDAAQTTADTAEEGSTGRVEPEPTGS